MKNIVAVLIISIVLTVFSSCGTANDSFAAYLNDTNHMHQQAVGSPWEESEKSLFLQNYVNQNSSIDSVFSDDRLQEFCTPEPERYVNSDQLAEDVETIFQLLKETYGAYYYFGGDQVFNPVKQQILDEIKLLRSDTKIAPSTLESLLVAHLSSIIKDSHFEIGTSRINVGCQLYPYQVPNLYFESPISAYKAYMRPTITPDGMIKYAFIATSEDGRDLPKSAIIDQKHVSLDWALMEPYNFSERPYYDTSNKDGIEIITSRSMLYSSESLDALERFANAGAEYRSNKLLILDLRGNYGGNSSYALSWLQNFLGTDFQTKQMYAQRISTPFSSYVSSPVSLYDSTFSTWVQDQQSPWISQIIDGKQQKNNCVLFVLVDKNVASAAEDFIAWLRTVENVVIVGTNTSGTSVCGNICCFCLPNSKLMVSFGTSLTFYEGLENRDGIGFYPDLWVSPSVSLDYVLGLCKQNGLA